MDEVHFCEQTTLTKKWSLRGCQTECLTTNTLNKVSFVGFINVRDGILKCYEEPLFVAEIIEKSIIDYSNSLNNKVFILIYDNAAWHKKCVRLMKESGLYKHIHFLALPPYSPQYNPIERVWKHTRKERTHNKYFSSIDELRGILVSFFEKYKHKNYELVRLCHQNCII
jgi:transposase